MTMTMTRVPRITIWLFLVSIITCSYTSANAAALSCRLSLEVTNTQGQTLRFPEILGPKLQLESNKLSFDVVSIVDEELAGAEFPGIVTASVSFNPTRSRRSNPLDVAVSYSEDEGDSENGAILGSSIGRFSIGPEIVLTAMLPTIRPGVNEIQIRCRAFRRIKARPRRQYR